MKMTKRKNIHEMIQKQGRNQPKKHVTEAKDCYNILALFQSHVARSKTSRQLTYRG